MKGDACQEVFLFFLVSGSFAVMTGGIISIPTIVDSACDVMFFIRAVSFLIFLSSDLFYLR